MSESLSRSQYSIYFDHHKRYTDEHGEENPFGESMELVKAEAIARGCRPNKLMHALYCEAYLLFGRELVGAICNCIAVYSAMYPMLARSSTCWCHSQASFIAHPCRHRLIVPTLRQAWADWHLAVAYT